MEEALLDVDKVQQKLDRKKYLCPRDLSLGNFMYVIRKRMHIEPEKSLYLFKVIFDSLSLLSNNKKFKTIVNINGKKSNNNNCKTFLLLLVLILFLFILYFF